MKNPENIFSSRLLLILADKDAQANFQSIESSNKKRRMSNFLSAISLIFATINITLSRTIEIESILVCNIFIYLGLCMNFGFFIIALLNYYSLIDFKTKTKIFFYIFDSFSFLFVYVNIFFCFSYFKIQKESIELDLLLTTILVCFKITFFFFEIFDFLKSLITISKLFLIEIILIVCFNILNPGLLIFSFFISNLVTLFIVYFNEAKMKINFYSFYKMHTELMKELQYLTTFRKICDENKNSIVCLDNNFKVDYLNRSMRTIVNKDREARDTWDQSNYEFSRPQKESLYINNSIYLSLFLSNKVEYPMQNNKLNNLDQYQENLKILFSHISSVNEDLIGINKKLYKYLIDIHEFASKTDENKNLTFSFETFLGIILCENLDKNKIFNKFTLNRGNCDSYMKTEIKQQIDDRSKTDCFLKINETRAHGPLCLLKKTSYPPLLLLFKANIKLKNSVEKEYSVYCIIIDERICFILEDASLIVTKDSKDTMSICKSLYLSKISHELKNPVSNLLEINSLLNSDIKAINKIKYRPKLNHASESENSNYSSNFREGNVFSDSINSLKQNVTHLNCVTEMMHQILSDFNFYTILIDDEVSPSTEGTSLKRCLSSNSANNELSNRQNEISKKSSPNKLSGRFLSNKSLIVSPECNYQDIIKNTVNIFTTKVALDNKSSKIMFKVIFEKNIPNKIIVEKELFKSLIFNMLYHVYKTVSSALITFKVSLFTQKTLSTSKNSQLKFEVAVTGQIEQISANEDFGEMMNFGGMKTIKERGSSSEVDESIRIEQCNTISSNFSLENFHIKQIINNTNLSKRNKLIDNFNTMFQHYMSLIYSSKMGLNLQFNKISESESFTTFFIELKHQSQNNFLNVNSLNLNNQEESQSKRYSDDKDKPLETKEIIIPKIESSRTSKNESSVEFVISTEVKADESLRSKKTLHYSDEMKFEYLKFIKLDSKIKKHCKDAVVGQLEGKNNDEAQNYFIKLKSASSPNIKLKKTGRSNSIKTQNPFKKRFSINTEQAESEYKKLRRNTQILPRIPRLSSFCSSLHNSIIEKRRSSLSLNELNSNLDQIKVLICDDESLIRKTLHRFLSLFSKEEPSVLFDVQHAENGFECLDKIYNYYTTGKYFDILIIDETMPFFKGTQIINLLKTSIGEGNFRDLRIVSFTSYSSPDKIEFILSQGADWVINKPMLYEDFKDFLIKNILLDS